LQPIVEIKGLIGLESPYRKEGKLRKKEVKKLRRKGEKIS